MNKKNRAIN